MTSKNSFFNLLKEDFKRRLWVFVLAAVVFAGTFILAFTMCLQHWVGSYQVIAEDSFSWGLASDIEETVTLAEYTEQGITTFLSLNPWLCIVAVVGAVICGISGFSYLHSKKQVDFYHSLPIKRETLFAVRFLNGILLYLIPYAIGLLYVYFISVIFGTMTWNVLGAGLVGLLVHLMGFCVFYLTTILAMMLTGKLLIAFLGIGVFWMYAPAVYGLVITLRDTFFVTSYQDSIAIVDAFDKMRYLTPIGYYFHLYESFENGSSFLLELAGFPVYAAILTGVCLCLYRKRMSEKAESAMSFRISEPIIRTLIAVPVGAVVGFLLYSIQRGNSGEAAALVWLVFGSALGTVLTHGIMESLYHEDIRKCLSHKLQLAVTVVAAILLPLFFYNDTFGYDSYLPDQSEVKEMAIYNSNFRFYGGSFISSEGTYTAADEYVLENMKATEFEEIYRLAEVLSGYTKKHRKEMFYGSGIRITDTEKDYYGTDVIIKYTLKNGKEVYRSYECNYYDMIAYFERIYENEEVKQTLSPLFAAEKSGLEAESLACTSGLSEESYTIKRNVEEILKVYRKELMQMGYQDLRTQNILGELEIDYESDKKNMQFKTACSTPIYACMTETLEVLKAYGWEPATPANAEDVLCIRIEVYHDNKYISTKEGAVDVIAPDQEISEDWIAGEKEITVERDEYKTTILISDREWIAACSDSMIYSGYTGAFGRFPEVEDEISVEAVYLSGRGEAQEQYTKRYCFLKGQIPDFIKELLGK